MTQGFQILPADTITSAQITVAPPEIHADWAAGTFNKGTTVIRQQAVYECQADGVTSDPLIGVAMNPIEWVRLGPSNRMAVFDGRGGTYSERTDGADLVFRFAPDPFFTGVQLTGVVGAAVTITQYGAGGAVVRQEQPSLIDFAGHNSPWSVLFAPWVTRPSAGVLGLIPLIGEVEVRVAPTAGVARIGEIIVGRVAVLGKTSPEVSRRYLDFSTYRTDDFGVLDMTDREGVPLRQFTVLMDSADVAGAEATIIKVMGARCAVIPHEDMPDLVTFGYVSDWGFTDRVFWDAETGARVGQAELQIEVKGIK